MNKIITIDGDNHYYNNLLDINISIGDRKIRLIRKKDYNFIQKVNDKFLK